ncbi:PREDICTED: snurportin-1 isoform X2 [Nicrophorus vespilloides]|uniref:Snurportin-1 n=1 Tax=Nicrophorus vespilloides TaxID=110193 RepID=A0ABM1N2T1_NICVS|nr:PREDICTED: snurportin-1 isoform X2 [Nicrophorus vespilloides]
MKKMESGNSLESNSLEDIQFYSSHIHLYKAAGSKATQTDRRKALLKAVKEHNASIDEKRGITELFSDTETNDEEEPMEGVCEGARRRRRKYADKLMLSEYFIERPDDLEHNWIFKLCPLGVRNLVVAHNRTTKAYNKNGVLQSEFESLLPGGAGNKCGSKFTILDCIFSPTTSVYYIIDILAWNSFSLVNCSTEFRFFFLKSKLEENHDITQKTKRHRYPFLDVIGRPAQLNLIEDVLSHFMENENEEKLDGVLFYHSEVDYRGGCTPLVGWLKPYMVPEILGIPVAAEYMSEKPENYTSLKDRVEKMKTAYSKTKTHKPRREKRIKDVEMVNIVDDLELD